MESARGPRVPQEKDRRGWLSAATGAVAIVVVVASLVVAVVGSWGDDTDGGNDGDQATAWHALLARHTEDGLSRQLALDAFATLVGPVPGGHRVAGTAVGTHSATPAVRWMLAVWDDLAPAQREAFQRAVYGPEPAALTGVVGQPSDRDPELEEELQPEVDAVAEDFTTRAGVAMPQVEVVVSTVDDPDGDTYADATYRTSAAPQPPAGEVRGSTCVLTFYPPATEARVGSPQEQEDFVAIVAHELYHCHQFLAQDHAGADIDADLPDWLVEGAAEWAGDWYASQAHTGYVSTEGWWEDYFAWPVTAPGSSLYRLSYDAVGFFAHLDHAMAGSVGEDVWSTIDAMLLSADSEPAFTRAAEAGGAVFLRQWAMGTFLNPDLGSEWFATGPGLPELGPTDVVDRTLTADDPVEITVDAAPGVARAQVAVVEQPEVLRADIAGHGAFHWAGPELEPRGRTEWYDAPQGEVRWYCFTGDCRCPEGETTPDVFDMPPPSTVSVALTGGTESATVALTATTVDELCDPDEDPDDDPEPPVEPVRNCVDVLGVVRAHAPHYDTQSEITTTSDAFQCSITYTRSPVLDELGNYIELGVLDEILVTAATTDDDRPEACPPDGYCVESRTQHVPEEPGIPAFDVVHTTVETQHVLLAASEETHGPQTPTDQLVQIALKIEAGIAG